MFFVGGLGRALSLALVGPPTPFFLFLMAIELGLPPVVGSLKLVGGRLTPFTLLPAAARSMRARRSAR